MFRKTSLRLTALYLTIIMFISLAFSVSIYQVSVRELDKGLKHQRETLVIGLRKIDIRTLDSQRLLITTPAEMLNESKANLILNLLMVNLTILVGGGFLSYYLARRTLKPIEDAHEAQKRFTSDASHELRTPIAVMQTEIEVSLMDKNLTLADAKKQLSSNLEELGHLTSLSEGLLRLARLEDNELVKKQVDLKSILDSAIGRVGPRAEKKSITIIVKNEAKQKFLADRSSIEEAVVIILDNAIKYSPKESTVEISNAKDQQNIKIAIKDQGPGIDKADLPHIFERFYRSNKARSKDVDNSYGLGLSIAKKIVDIHGGKICVDSKPDHGSTFTIIVPIK